MQNLPLIILFNFAASMVCLVAAVKMYLVAQEKKNIKINYFFYSFTFIFVYLFAIGLPLFFVKDSFSASVITLLFRPFLLIGGMFLCLIPINFIKSKIIEKIYIFTTLAIVLVSSVLTFFGLNEVKRVFSHREIDYWIYPESTMITASIILTGVFLIFSFLFAAGFYFRFALEKRGEEVAFGKAVMIGAGCLFLIFAIVSSHIFGVILREFVVTNIVASLFFIMSVVFLIASVNYKGESKGIYYE